MELLKSQTARKKFSEPEEMSANGKVFKHKLEKSNKILSFEKLVTVNVWHL